MGVNEILDEIKEIKGKFDCKTSQGSKTIDYLMDNSPILANLNKIEKGANLHLRLADGYDQLKQDSDALQNLLKAEKGLCGVLEASLTLANIEQKKGRQLSALEFYERATKAFQKLRYTLVNISQYYVKIGEYDKAVEMVDKGIFHESTEPLWYQAKGSILSNAEKHGEVRDCFNEAYSHGAANSLILAYLYKNTSDEKYALKIKDKVFDESNTDYSAYTLFAQQRELWKFWDGTRQIDFIDMMINQMVKKNEFESSMQKYKAASHSIKIIKSDIIAEKALIVKESHNDISDEINNNHLLREIIGESCEIPHPLKYISKDSKHYYVMERKNGKTLSRKIRDNEANSNMYDNIVNVLSKIHVLMPINDLEDYQIREKLESRLERSTFDINHFQPILSTLENSKYIGYNKSSTPDNWMFSDAGELICIDTENKGKIPYSVDLAQLLTIAPDITVEEKIGHVDNYINYTNILLKQKNETLIDRDNFHTEFCNAVVYRSVTLDGYYRDKDRVDEAQSAKDAGVEMIEFMKQNDMIEQRYSSNYEAILNYLN